jgi:DnaJ-class molecular chaperone
MSKKDHYEVLGVERTVDESGIKTAFKRLAKRHHPDLSGPEATRHFQEIVEAYEVLSDPKSRASYNESLRKRDADSAASCAGVRPPDPLDTIVSVRSPRAWASVSRGERRPSLFDDDAFDFLFKGFTSSSYGGRRLRQGEVLNVEVLLSPEEAARGGMLPLWHPALLRCRFCGSVGLDPFLICKSCFNRAVAGSGEALPVQIPAGIQDGSILKFTIPNPDGTGVILRVHIQVLGP